MQDRLTQARIVKEVYQGQLLAIPGVHAVMTTIVNGQPVIEVWAETSVVLPQSISDIPIRLRITSHATMTEVNRQFDVLPRATIQAGYMDRSFAISPAPGGVQICHDDMYVGGILGTLGLVLSKGGNKYLLSNYHVIGADSMLIDRRPIGSPIWQAYFSDDFRIARLVSSVPIEADYTGKVNYVDLGVGQFDSPALAADYIFELARSGRTELLENYSIEPAIGDFVIKSGRTSGITTNSVISTDATIDVTGGAGANYRMVDQIVSGNISQPGDSGSAVFNIDGRFVGLLSAGSDEITIINKAKYVISHLGPGYSFQPPVAQITFETVPIFPISLTTLVSPAGSGTILPQSSVYDFNAFPQVTIDWNPNSGYKRNWVTYTNYMKHYLTFISPLSFRLRGDVTVTGVFNLMSEPEPSLPAPVPPGPGEVQPKWYVTIRTWGEGNTLSIPGRYPIYVSSVMGVEAYPAPGYYFYKWWGTMQKYPENPTNFHLDLYINENREITAVFVQQGQEPPPDPPPSSTEYAITVLTVGQGTTNPAPGTYLLRSGPFIVEALPAVGNRFKEWLGWLPGEKPFSNPITLQVAENRSIMAVFEALPPPSTATISGVVRNSSNSQPIPGASISLGQGIPAATSDGTGTYQMSGVLPGTYTLTAQANGYQPVSMVVNLVVGGNTVDIVMTPIAVPPSKPSILPVVLGIMAVAFIGKLGKKGRRH